MFDRFVWEYYCSWYPKKEYEKTDPLKNKCNCGYEFKFNFFQKLLMLIKEDYVFTCPQCLHKRKYRLICHIVRDVGNERELIKHNNLLR